MTDAAPGRRRPAERYGDATGPGRRRLLLAVVAVVAVAALAVLLQISLRLADPDVTYDTQGYRVLGDAAVEVTFAVTKDADATAVCRVEALNSAFAPVGLATQEVGPGRRGQVVTTTVRTVERATSGRVRECELR